MLPWQLTELCLSLNRKMETNEILNWNKNLNLNSNVKNDKRKQQNYLKLIKHSNEN